MSELQNFDFLDPSDQEKIVGGWTTAKVDWEDASGDGTIQAEELTFNGWNRNKTRGNTSNLKGTTASDPCGDINNRFAASVSTFTWIDDSTGNRFYYNGSSFTQIFCEE